MTGEDHLGKHAGRPSRTRIENSRATYLPAMLKVCDALAYAHSRGVFHRDLKPANIMLGAFGEVLVLDWGIAMLLGEGGPSKRKVSIETSMASPPSSESSVLGTPIYMSPEQASGRNHLVDERSDVYSLGAVIYQILTLRYPVMGDRQDMVLQQVIDGAIVPPSTRVVEGKIPEELDALVMKAMAHDPDDRYQTMEALRKDLESHLTGHTLEAARYTRLQRVAKWKTRNKALAGLGIVSILVMIILMAGLILSLTEARRIAQDEVEARKEERRAREEAEALASRIALEARRDHDYAEVKRLEMSVDRLWPAHPDRIVAMETWLQQASELTRGAADHREGLGMTEQRGTRSPDERWLLQQQRELVEGLVRIEETLMPEVLRRIEWARELGRVMCQHEGEWHDAMDSFRSGPDREIYPSHPTPSGFTT